MDDDDDDGQAAPSEPATSPPATSADVPAPDPALADSAPPAPNQSVADTPALAEPASSTVFSDGGSGADGMSLPDAPAASGTSVAPGNGSAPDETPPAHSGTQSPETGGAAQLTDLHYEWLKRLHGKDLRKVQDDSGTAGGVQGGSAQSGISEDGSEPGKTGQGSGDQDSSNGGSSGGTDLGAADPSQSANPSADQPTQPLDPTAGQPSQPVDPNTGQLDLSADPNATPQPVDPQADLTKKPSDNPVWQQGYATGLANPSGDCPTPSPYPADAAAIYQDGVANGQAVGRQQPDQSVDPSSGPNRSIDPDAAQPNQSVDPDAEQLNQSVNPGVEPNQSTDPNSGLPNQSVDLSVGPNQSIDPNSVPGPNQSADPASGQPNQSVNPPPVKETSIPNKTAEGLFQQGYADGRSSRGAVCPAHADAAGEAAYNRGYMDGKAVLDHNNNLRHDPSYGRTFRLETEEGKKDREKQREQELWDHEHPISKAIHEQVEEQAGRPDEEGKYETPEVVVPKVPRAFD